jgi:uncharacterized membrane protein
MVAQPLEMLPQPFEMGRRALEMGHRAFEMGSGLRYCQSDTRRDVVSLRRLDIHGGISFARASSGGAMESRAKLFGHPIHQMLIVFPLGVLAMSLVFDLIARFGGQPKLHEAAFYMIAAGIISGLIAAVFGLIDFLGIPGGTRARRIGLLHGVGNVVVVAIFAASWWLRRDDPAQPEILAIVLSAVAAGIATITGWLGGELVDRLGVGVDDGANLDAPSSLHGPVAASATTRTRA